MNSTMVLTVRMLARSNLRRWLLSSKRCFHITALNSNEGGDGSGFGKKSEADLLKELLANSKFKNTKEPTKSGAADDKSKPPSPADPSATDQNIKSLFGKEIFKSAEQVADTVSKSSDAAAANKSKAKDDIVQKLAEMEQQTTQRARGMERKSEADDLRKLFGLPPAGDAASAVDAITNTLRSMRVEKAQPQPAEPRPQQRFTPPAVGPSVARLQEALKRDTSLRSKVNLYEGERLNIFTAKERPTEEKRVLKEWEDLTKETNARKYGRPPRSSYEELIQWTKEGKLWPYPMDNDYLWDEKDIGFHEHVFLEGNLEEFPETGPIRHFMELVTLGLSKNPFMTLEEKHGHIEWFKKYFEEMGPQIMKLHALETKHNV